MQTPPPRAGFGKLTGEPAILLPGETDERAESELAARCRRWRAEGLRRARGRAALGAAAYLSNSPLPPAPAAAADDPKDKKPRPPPPRAVAAANAFLDALDAKQREKALLEFDSDKKPNWSNLPVTFVPRNGVKLGDLTKEQRDKAMGVVAAVLSKDGYQKVIDIMDGDQKLARQPGKGGKGKGGGKGPMFGKDLYYLAIFGTAVRDEAVDGAVRRPPPRGQRHRGRQALRPHPDAHRDAAGALQARRRRRCARSAGRATPRSS